MEERPEPTYRNSGWVYHLNRLNAAIAAEARARAEARHRERLDALRIGFGCLLAASLLVGGLNALRDRIQAPEGGTAPRHPPAPGPLLPVCEGYISFEATSWTGRPCIRFPYAPRRDSGGECALEYGVRLRPAPLPDADAVVTDLRDASP